MRYLLADALPFVVFSLILTSPNWASAAGPAKEVGPVEVVESFWDKIKTGDVEGAIALHTFSEKTKRLADGIKAEYSKWSTPLKSGEVKVTIGNSEVHGTAAVVMITCYEGQTNPKPEPAYLVRREGTWKMLMPGMPGDASAHELDADTVASMKALKTWVASQQRK